MIKKVELIDKREFTATTLDKNAKIFVFYIMTLLAIFIHPNRKALIRASLAKKAPNKVVAEYLNYADIFSLDLAMKLSDILGLTIIPSILQNRNNYLMALSIAWAQ